MSDQLLTELPRETLPEHVRDSIASIEEIASPEALRALGWNTLKFQESDEGFCSFQGDNELVTFTINQAQDDSVEWYFSGVDNAFPFGMTIQNLSSGVKVTPCFYVADEPVGLMNFINRAKESVDTTDRLARLASVFEAQQLSEKMKKVELVSKEGKAFYIFKTETDEPLLIIELNSSDIAINWLQRIGPRPSLYLGDFSIIEDKVHGTGMLTDQAVDETWNNLITQITSTD